MSFTCRRGHHSISDEYCDVCGARNWQAGQPAVPAWSRAQATGGPVPPPPRPDSRPAPPLPVASSQQGISEPEVAEPAVPGPPCPGCGTPREAGDRYCASCAYDFETGERWEAAPAVSSGGDAGGWQQEAPASLVIVLSVDADGPNESGCPEPPAESGEHVFMLDRPSIVIGREPAGGVHVPVAADPYVSRRHAEIVDLGGVWGIRDLGSTNGTKLNGQPLVGSEVKLLQPDDAIELGCFSKLTVRERSTTRA